MKRARFYHIIRIKSDGCDVVPGITESMRGQWGGDLGNGELAKKYKEYCNIISTVKGLCRQLMNSIRCSLTVVDLGIIKKELEDYLEFTPTGSLFGSK